MTDSVRLLHGCLTRQLRHRGGQEQPVTVAEIYQDLVPYRAVRSEIGVELNADYEHALVRLLAGEGGLARLEPAEVRAELQRELGMPDPNVTLYRKFAGCDVWVALDPIPAGMPDDGAAAVAQAGPDPEVAIPDWLATIDRKRAGGAGSAASDARASRPAPARPPPPPAASAAPSPASRAAEEPCPFCGADLPHGRAVRFCPQCGGDQERPPCRGCGELLEAAWRFCVACGTARP
jgi:hypothetical protein